MIEPLIDFRNLEKGRWYSLEAGTDIFGQKVLVRRWGSIHSRRGSQSMVPIFSDTIGLKLLKADLKRSARRGYT